MPHVLLVDDEEPLRESLSYTLQKEGYTVTTAADGHSAIKQFHKQVPDVILLDLMLPEVDGSLLADSSFFRRTNSDADC